MSFQAREALRSTGASSRISNITPGSGIYRNGDMHDIDGSAIVLYFTHGSDFSNIILF